MSSTTKVHCLSATTRNVSASCVLMLFAGAMYAIGVFNPSISAYNPALAGVWESSMATMTLISAPAMIFTALYLSESDGDPHEKTKKLHVLTSLGGLCFLSLSVGSVGIAHTYKGLLRLSVTLQGIPFGAFYVISIELLAAWMPHCPGLAIGIGQMSFGIGTIAFSGIFEQLTKTLGTVPAIHASALALATATWLTVPFMQWPAGADTPKECVNTQTFKGVKISTKRLPFLRDFWLYMGTVFTSQVGFALVPFYFEMSADFGVSQQRAVLLFQLTNSVTTVARLCAGALADRYGSRRLIFVLLGFQVALYAIMAASACAHAFTAFACGALGVLVVFSSVASVSAVFARDLFGPMNSAVVFGVGAGVTMGLGESISVTLAGALAADIPRAVGPVRFNLYFAIAAIVSAAGTLCAWAAKPCPAALPLSTRVHCDEECPTELLVEDEEGSTVLSSIDDCSSKLLGNSLCGLQAHDSFSSVLAFQPHYGSVNLIGVA